MRKVVFQMMTTLNGRVDDPDAWMSGVSDDLYTDIEQRYDTFDTVLVGSTTYKEMFAYWPGAEDEEGSTEINKRMARRMNTYRKYVISREGEPGALEWTNSQRVVARDDEELVAFVTDLKAQQGGDIHLSGGASLAQSMVRLGLVDEFHVYVYPVVSPGAAWFGQIDDQRGLELVSATTYDNGILGLSYRPGTNPVPERRESFTEMLT